MKALLIVLLIALSLTMVYHFGTVSDLKKEILRRDEWINLHKRGDYLNDIKSSNCNFQINSYRQVADSLDSVLSVREKDLVKLKLELRVLYDVKLNDFIQRSRSSK